MTLSSGEQPGAVDSSVRSDVDLAARRSSRFPLGDLLFALVMVGLGIFALLGSFTIFTPVGVILGPSVVPTIVGVLLLVSAVAVLVSVLLGKRVEVEEGEDIDPNAKTDWLTLTKIVGALIIHMLLINVTGWAPAAAILFGLVAWSLGAKKWWMAFLVGIVVALVIQVVFGGVLGISLPWGPALEWLGRMF